MDKDTLRASTQKTGRLVVVDEACLTGSAAAEIAAMVVEDPATFRTLKAPPVRVCAPDVPMPYAPIMEQYCIPNADRIIEAVRQTLAED